MLTKNEALNSLDVRENIFSSLVQDYFFFCTKNNKIITQIIYDLNGHTWLYKNPKWHKDNVLIDDTIQGSTNEQKYLNSNEK